jgi:hypothetical protein
LGIDHHRLLAAAALTPASIDRADSRVPAQAVVALWSTLARWTRNPDLGLELAESDPVSAAYGLVGLRAMSSPTLGEALASFAKHVRLVSEEADATVLHDRNGTTFELALPAAPAVAERCMADRAFASCVLLSRRWTGETVRPRHVRFRHPRPGDLSGYRRIFDCDVQFGKATNAIVLDRDLSDRPLRTAQNDVAAYLEIADRRRERASWLHGSARLSAGVPSVDGLLAGRNEICRFVTVGQRPLGVAVVRQAAADGAVSRWALRHWQARGGQRAPFTRGWSFHAGIPAI